jgi:hypothetical protein
MSCWVHTVSIDNYLRYCTSFIFIRVPIDVVIFSPKQADAYTSHRDSIDLTIATENEDTWLALQIYNAFHRNLTAFARHLRRTEAQLCSDISRSVNTSSTSSHVPTNASLSESPLLPYPCREFNASIALAADAFDDDIEHQPLLPLVLPTRTAAAAFSMETVYHADPLFMHQARVVLK